MTALLSGMAQAGVYLRPMGLYTRVTSDYGSGPTSSSRTLFETSAGYLGDKGLMIGAIYQSDNASMATTSYGPSVGWTTSKDFGPFVAAHYFIKSSVGDGLAAITSGTGYQADLGLRALVSRMTLALQLSYKSFSYDEELSGGTAQKISRIDPSIGLFISF